MLPIGVASIRVGSINPTFNRASYYQYSSFVHIHVYLFTQHLLYIKYFLDLLSKFCDYLEIWPTANVLLSKFLILTRWRFFRSEFRNSNEQSNTLKGVRRFQDSDLLLV